jgi:hypothetical protein
MAEVEADRQGGDEGHVAGMDKGRSRTENNAAEEKCSDAASVAQLDFALYFSATDKDPSSKERVLRSFVGHCGRSSQKPVALFITCVLLLFTILVFAGEGREEKLS